MHADKSYYGGSGTSPNRRSSPLRPSDENELIRAFKEQLILERELEKAKIDLVESCPDFNLFDAFSIIDTDRKGYLQPYDLKTSFDHPDRLDLPHLTLEDVEMFFTRYDKDDDRKLRF